MPMMIVCDKMTYIPGQIVTGHVVIVSKSPQKVKGLTMRFIGRSSKLLGDVEGTKRYKKEVYFDEKMDIFGHDGSNTQLRVGETLYPFTFPLPPGLPSSFEWPDGNVLYFIEAKLTRTTWKDKRVSSRIKVEGVFDLNLEPNILSPIEVKRQKYVKHLLTKSGPYGFTFKCNRSGFVRGHSLPFTVDIRNLSKVDSRKLRVSLLQEVKCSDGKSVATLVEQVKGPAVTAGEVVTWEARLKIPGGIPPTNLGNVLNYPNVIPLYYLLHIQLSLKNCREDPICIKIPVTIGTISVQRRAISVPALDDETLNPLIPYSTNGHRMDCPMSQLLLPSAAISTSQFSPHLVQVNTATTYSQTHVSRGHVPHHHHTLATRTVSHNPHRTPPVQILGPVRQYEYYFEYEDSATGATRSVTTRGETLPVRRRNQNHARGHHTTGRHFYHGSAPVRESPPPSYDEIFTLPRNFNATPEPPPPPRQSNSNETANDENTQTRRRPLPPEIVVTSSTPGPEVVHKRVLSSQLSSSSSSSVTSEECVVDDDEDISSPLDPRSSHPLTSNFNGTTNNNNNNRSSDNCNANSGGSSSSSAFANCDQNGDGDDDDDDDDEDERSSDEDELDDDNDDDGDGDGDEEGDSHSLISTNDEFLSCNGSSGSFDELKCHESEQSGYHHHNGEHDDVSENIQNLLEDALDIVASLEDVKIAAVT